VPTEAEDLPTVPDNAAALESLEPARAE
jgi:hypothetical protein